MTAGARKAQAELYRVAASERSVCARELYDGGRYVEANYFAGLAVECILRAYRIRIDPEFDARHDRGRLYKMAKFADIVPQADIDRVNAALEEVAVLWSNEYRFLPNYALREAWKKRKLFRRGADWIRGDFVKERTRQLVNAAAFLVNLGESRWKNSCGN
jgi:hypothetical protein